ncbi:MAG: IS4 family transposase [Betaproteobacteria bacterium]|nr:IS4 family transposase [Betaproteobacteria bacterium]
MNIGKTLFAQVMEFIPWSSFSRIVKRYQGDAGVRSLSAAEHFRVMAFAQLTWRESLRDIEASLGANPSKLYGMGFRSLIKKSTLADANERRNWRIWADLATVLIRRARKIYIEDDLGLDLKSTVYALDSSTIDLCMSLFPWALFRSTKSAVKIHTLLDLRGAIPAFIYLSDGKTHDTKVLDMLVFEPGAFYVMDRGYMDFKRLYRLHQSGAFFVTRAKENLRARRVYSAPTDRSTGVIADQRVMLEGFYAIQDYPEHMRRIRFNEPTTGQTLIFLTNNTSLPATTIAALYKNRWQVELFFKWIKQHLRIKHFLGTSENAVKTQIWCAVCTYVLIAIIKKELQLKPSLYTCLQILSVCIFEKNELSCALQPNAYTMKIQDNPNQLILFDY